MIFAVDVYYRKTDALAAGLLFRNWNDSAPVNEITVRITQVEKYASGLFYKRELPCLLTLIKQLDCMPEFIIIDGHVFLDSDCTPGLGKYLYDALNGESAVIGVAKSRYKSTPDDAAIYRGGSKRPLYVTAVGINKTSAKNLIMQMHGDYRIPTILKKVDLLSKMKSWE
jgi:deoxyribonuclease V